MHLVSLPVISFCVCLLWTMTNHIAWGREAILACSSRNGGSCAALLRPFVSSQKHSGTFGTTKAKACRRFRSALRCSEKQQTNGTNFPQRQQRPQMHHQRRNHRLSFSSSSSEEEKVLSLSLVVPTPDDMEEVGALLSSVVLEDTETTHSSHRPASSGGGSVVLLDGDLGAGKTCFARGFIRAATGDWGLSVTSPTYLLSNAYKSGIAANTEIYHMDLYRLSGKPGELAPLNLDYVFRHCISLIEWPSRFGETTVPVERLEIDIKIRTREHVDDSGLDNDDAGFDEAADDDDDIQSRVMTLRPHGSCWEKRIQTILAEGYLDDMLLLDDER